MPLKQMRYFAGLYQKGNETVLKRKEILLSHSKTLDHQKELLNKCSKILSAKLEIYEKILGEE